MQNQTDLFMDTPSTSAAMVGLLDFKPGFFDAVESARLFEDLKETIAWKQETLVLYGKKIPMPRLTAWYGDTGVSYRYSGVTFIALPWTVALSEIKLKAELFAGVSFNSVLLNLYRDGNDSMGWHNDDEKELGINPIIASVNFGQERRFDFRRKDNHQEKHQITLTDGSILVMKGNIQHHWQHQVAKSAKAKNTRINLTFRSIKTNVSK